MDRHAQPSVGIHSKKCLLCRTHIICYITLPRAGGPLVALNGKARLAKSAPKMKHLDKPHILIKI